MKLKDIIEKIMIPESKAFLNELDEIIKNNSSSEDDLEAKKDMEYLLEELQTILKSPTSSLCLVIEISLSLNSTISCLFLKSKLFNFPDIQLFSTVNLPTIFAYSSFLAFSFSISSTIVTGKQIGRAHV